MAEVTMASSESDDELALEVLSGFVKTVYETAKENVLTPAEGVSTSEKKPVRVKEADPFFERVREFDLFQDVLVRAVKELEMENIVVEPDNPRSSARTVQVVIPLDSDISEKCFSVWEKPATVEPVDWFMQGKYHGKGEDAILTMSHPPADSVVVFAASGGRTINADNFPIPGKEAETLDSVGKKIYQAGGLGLMEANTAVALSLYNKHLWSQLTEIFEALPEDAKKKALKLQKEGMAIGKCAAQASLDQAEVSARIMATGVIQRRRAWFNASGITPQVEHRVLDLPFDGTNLFHPTTEAVIEHAQKEPLKNVKRRVKFHRPVSPEKFSPSWT